MQGYNGIDYGNCPECKEGKLYLGELNEEDKRRIEDKETEKFLIDWSKIGGNSFYRKGPKTGDVVLVCNKCDERFPARIPIIK